MKVKTVASTFDVAQLVPRLHRDGLVNVMKDWLSTLPTNKKNFLPLSDWSPVPDVIKAAETGNLAKIDAVLKKVKDKELRSQLRSGILPDALAAFEHFDELVSIYPIGPDVYIQNLNARSGISLLVQAGKFDRAIKLYRKHQFGYHSKNMVYPLLRGLYKARKTKLLNNFIKQEYQRAVNFRTLDLCLAGGLSGDKKDAASCRKEEKNNGTNASCSCLTQ